ncbi:MAG: ferredoxin-type protein NapF [Burkholderiaceae bacterium]
MVESLSRRALLRGRVKATVVVRPPFAIRESEFRQACDACGECLPACPEQIIQTDEWGRPSLSFTDSGCTFCDACTQACDSHALSKNNPRPWPWTATLNKNCLNARGVSCRLCEEFCEARALVFKPALGGRYDLTLNANDCTGCGACIAPCPTNAISILDEQSNLVEVSE